MKTLDLGRRGWVATDPGEISVLERVVSVLDSAPKTERCETCNDARFVLARDKKIGGSTVLEGMPPTIRDVEPCPACNAPRPDELLLSAGIPSRYAGCTFETFPVDDAKRLAVETVQAWAGGLLTGDVLLMGGNGRGKTGLAVAAVVELCTRGIAARFTPAVALLDRVRASFDVEGGPDVLAPYRSCPVLVLDDLGAVRVTPWVQEQMTALIEARRTANRQTVITCDVGAEDLLDWYGPRLVSRLREYRRVTVGGRDLRGRLCS